MKLNDKVTSILLKATCVAYKSIIPFQNILN